MRVPKAAQGPPALPGAAGGDGGAGVTPRGVTAGHPAPGPSSPAAPFLAGFVGCGGVPGLSSHVVPSLAPSGLSGGKTPPPLTARARAPAPGDTNCGAISRPPSAACPQPGAPQRPGAAPVPRGTGTGAWQVPSGDMWHLPLHWALGDVRHVPRRGMWRDPLGDTGHVPQGTSSTSPRPVRLLWQGKRVRAGLGVGSRAERAGFTVICRTEKKRNTL